MKSTKILMFALAATVLSGCNFLDNNSPSAKEPKDVFSDPVETEQAIFAVYDLMGSNNSYRNRIACGFSGLNTDVEWSTQSTSSTAGAKALVTYDCGVTNDRISNVGGADIWTYLNTMIERSNNAIEGLREYGNVKEDAKMRYLLGEALFLRSFAYLEMVKYWGDVPARFTSIAADMDGVMSPKTDRNVVYEQLRKDLTEAAELMPWSPEVPVLGAKNNIGRASKASALALLARADLMYAGKAVRPGSDGYDVKEHVAYKVTYNIKDAELRKAVYQEALEACAQIIHAEHYKLASDFATPFRDLCMGKSTYSDMEFIWVMPFKRGARGQFLGYNAVKLGSDAAGALIGKLPGWGRTDATGGSSGQLCVSPYIIPMFEEGDLRKAVTIVPGVWEYNDGTTESSDAEVREFLFPHHNATESKLFQKHAQLSNFYCGKYRYEWYGANGDRVTSTDDGVAVPVIRYSDVLLMFAEAAIGGYEGNQPVNKTNLIGLEQYNSVRERAGLPRRDSYTMEDIDKERAIEFCGEYIRKYDLMRWGILRERMVAVNDYIRTISADGTRHAMNMGDTLYYKYVYNESFQGYEIDVNTMYGLLPGETKRKPEMTKENGWQAKDVYNSESKGFILSENNYPIYAKEEQLETRQYWPIFLHNVTAAGPQVLWNNYGYGE